MLKNNNLIFRGLAGFLSMAFICQHQPVYGQETKTFSQKVSELPPSEPHCRDLVNSLEKVCSNVAAFQSCHLNDEGVRTLVALLQKAPNSGTHLRALSEEFFKIQKPTQEDIEAFYKLAGWSCWDNEEVKIWDILSSHFHQGQSQMLIINQAKSSLAKMGGDVLNGPDLMMQIQIVRSWFAGGLLAANKPLQDRIEILRNLLRADLRANQTPPAKSPARHQALLQSEWRRLQAFDHQWASVRNALSSNWASHPKSR